MKNQLKEGVDAFAFAELWAARRPPNLALSRLPVALQLEQRKMGLRQSKVVTKPAGGAGEAAEGR